jgi:hypothetical protein
MEIDMLATPQSATPFRRLRDASDRLRPAIGFNHPREVLRDPFLDREGKRAILSSWASDASGVENWPTLRWLSGTQGPVPLSDILEALSLLDCANQQDLKCDSDRVTSLAAAPIPGHRRNPPRSLRPTVQTLRIPACV